MAPERLDFARHLTRLSEREHLDDLAIEQTRAVARQLQKWIPGLYDSVALKVGRALVERTISPTRIGEICDVTVDKARKGLLRSPAFAYFTSACKREWAKAGVPWDDGGPSS